MIDMKPLSREEALLKCKKQWLWVAATGMRKEKYPFKGLRPRSSCYACEYNRQNDGDFCDGNCIIHWPGGGCTAEESPFKAYCNAGAISSERKEAALAVVALCDKGLAQIKIKK
jgi:hypothetical protein